MQYVARQPILDAQRCLTAFELLFRNSTKNQYPPGDPEIACKKTMDTAVLLGLDTISGGRRVFINCTENLILDGLATLFPPERTVLELLESVRPTPELVKTCSELKRAGYRIALDDFTEQPGYQPLIHLADIIKIDVRATPASDWPVMAARYLRNSRQLLAEKVETEEEFTATRNLGFTLFQGFLFSRPRVLSTSSLDGSDGNRARILRALARAELDFRELEKIIKSDPALCYRLLRFLNSTAFYLPDEIRSVLHALELLGEIEIRRWMLLMCTLGAGVQPSKRHLLEATLVRARFAEVLAPRMRLPSPSMFILGILSLMHAILDVPMERLAKEVAITTEVREALLGTSNRLRVALDLVLAYEVGDWEQCEALRKRWQIPAQELSNTYLSSIQWARKLTDDL